MKKLLTCIAMLCSCLCVNAQSYDVNEDGNVDVSDVSTLIQGILTGSKGKLYYSKQEVDSMLNIVNEKLFLLGMTENRNPKVEINYKETIKNGETTIITIDTRSKGKVTYSTSTPNILSVTEKGQVTAHSEGTGKITISIAESEPYKQYNTTISIKAISNDGATYSLDNKYFTFPKAIDLGLPSGTLWADRNIGASSADDYGYSFLWGENKYKIITDFGNASKDLKFYDDYKWFNKNTVTKYNTNSLYGELDGISTIQDEDNPLYYITNRLDIPTKEQVEELLENCTLEHLATGGDIYESSTEWDNFILVSKINGNKLTLHLPYLRCEDGPDVWAMGRICNFWTKDLYNSDTHYAYALEISCNYCYEYNEEKDDVYISHAKDRAEIKQVKRNAYSYILPVFK